MTRRRLENYNAALPLRRQVGDLRGEAQSLDDIGVVYDDIDEEQKGLEYFSQSLPIHQSLHDLWGEALTLNNFGTAYDSLGEKKEALDYFNRALPLKRATGNRRGESTTLSNMCWAEFTLGEWQSALDHCAAALAIQRKSGDRLGETQTLTNIGSLYLTLGDVPDALKKLERALALAREAGSRQWEAMVLNAIGLGFYEQGDIANALANHEMALPLRRAAGDRSGEAATLSNLGKCHDKRGEKTVAVDYFNQSLAIARNIDSRRWEAAALGNIGWLYATQNGEKALEYFSQARPLYEGLGDRRGEASILYGMASVEAARGELSAALAHIESTLTIVEALRTKVINQQLRTSYFSSVREYYELYVDLLMRLDTNDPTKGYAATAFEVSERARARNLLETLQEARADIRRGVDPALLERERSLQQLLDGKTERQMRLFAEHNEKQTATAKKEMEELLAQYQDLEAQIRMTSPRYAALTQPQPFRLAKIQKEVLDADTVLLEYSLGSERSYLWAVTEDSVASFQLPSGAEIELRARRVYDLLTARNRHQKNEADQQRNARLKRAELEYPEASLALSKIVIGPVVKLIHGKRLAIVADGALQYVPFGVLPMPDDKTSGTRYPLVVDHEVVNLPSASVLGASRRDLADRKSAPKVVAVFADPVFDRGDSRVKRNGQNPGRPQEVNQPTEPNASLSATSLSESHLTRSAADIGIGGEQKHLPRLVFSREEAKSILGVTPAEQGMEALDFNANRRAAISPELGQYRMIHFATHGLLDSEHPDLSGLVLSLVDEQGRSLNGFLDLEDIYNMNLPAELVTLSACETGLGKEVKGEGLVGLTRGFMYAGARRVVASLWKVDDVATAELMGRFYKGMLREGLRPAAALRQAQVEMWKQRQWADPYNWGAFTIQGEWR